MSPRQDRPLLSSEDSDDEHRGQPAISTQDPTETSPLLPHSDRQQEDGSDNGSLRSQTKKSSRRWPSIIAMAILGLLVILVILVGFLVPPAVKEYAEGAAIIEPTDLSVESITPDGIRARVQANFRLEGRQVENENSRRIGRFVTGIMRKIQTEETKLTLTLPHYKSMNLGTAVVPPITISLVDGHNTAIDIIADFQPGEADNYRMLVNKWLDGKLDTLKVTGSTDLTLKSGIFPLGTHTVVESMVLEGRDFYKTFSSLLFRQFGL